MLNFNSLFKVEGLFHSIRLKFIKLKWMRSKHKRSFFWVWFNGVESNTAFIKIGKKIWLILWNGFSVHEGILKDDDCFFASVILIDLDSRFPSDLKDYRHWLLTIYALINFDRINLIDFVPVQKVSMPRSLEVRILADLSFLCVFDQEVETFVHCSGLGVFLNELMDLGVRWVEFFLGLPGGLFDGSMTPLDEDESLSLLLLYVQHFLRNVLFLRSGNHLIYLKLKFLIF